jgi:cyclopropane-fatty-acyl-phospholipid synthase
VKIDDFVKDMYRSGDFEAVLPGGRRLVAGDGTGPKVRLRIADHATLARIMASPSLGTGEAYMSGRLVMEAGSIHDLVELTARNAGARIGRRTGGLARLAAKMVRERNARANARRNVAHHYDLSVDLYRAFLDEDLQYSCAYFARPGETLEQAQAAKKRHIAAKLALSPDLNVLDIGCGWGGMAMSLAAWSGARVHGITLSTEQLRTARTRAEAAGLGGRVEFSLTDYRDAKGPYDRIVSVGMFEHVGRPNYQAFFDQVAALLAEDGTALIHSIGRGEGPAATDGFTAKYIFPGGYIPALSEVLPAVERAGLWVTDIEILRLHYAETIRLWRERFAARREAMVKLYDERFCRMWEFYLSGAEVSFRYGRHMNFQLQLTKRRDALPLTRDYMAEAERQLSKETRRVA